ncbi:MAG: hypothetical protein AB3N14_09880 [Flavobacteriaceae bacterium]
MTDLDGNFEFMGETGWAPDEPIWLSIQLTVEEASQPEPPNSFYEIHLGTGRRWDYTKTTSNTAKLSNVSSGTISHLYLKFLSETKGTFSENGDGLHGEWTRSGKFELLEVRY